MIELTVLAMLAVVGVAVAALIGTVILVVKAVVWLVLLPFRLLFGLIGATLGLAFGAVGLVAGVAVLPLLFAAAAVAGFVLIVGAVLSVVLPLLPFILLGLLIWAIVRHRQPAVPAI